MSKPCPGPEEILPRLERLRALAEDVAGRELRLREARRRRAQLERRRAEAAQASARERLESRLTEAAEALAADRAAAETRHRARGQRLREAQRNVRKARTERIDAEEGRRKFDLQREMLRATRERDAGLAAAEAVHTAFSARLAAARADLEALHREARTLVAVFGRSVTDRLADTPPSTPVDATLPEEPLAHELGHTLDTIRTHLPAFRRRLLPRLSRAWPVWLILALSPLLLGPALPHLGLGFVTYTHLGAGAGAFVVLALLLHLLGRRLARPALGQLATEFGHARALLEAACSTSDETHQNERARLEAAHAAVTDRCNAGWSEVQSWLAEARTALPVDVDRRTARALARNDALLQAARLRLERHHAATVEHLRAGVPRSQEPAAEPSLRGTDDPGSLAAEAELAALWNQQALPLLQSLQALPDSGPATPAEADELLPVSWQPPLRPATAIRLGRVDFEAARILEALPADSSVTPRPMPRWSLPLELRFPRPGSLLLETGDTGRAEALGTLNAVVCRLLAGSPPGRVAFTVFDPVGLGQSFAGLTHLADEAEHLINGRIWTQSNQLEERLGELNEHLEKVIQMYLRNEYATIAEYNEQAGNIAEKYRFLVLADFPAGFTDLALRRLQSLAASGARCGVFLLVHWDQRQPLPTDFPAAALRQSALRITFDPSGLRLDGRSVPGAGVRLDPPPDTAAITAFIHRVARANRDSNRVEVPFEQIAPADEDLWSVDTGAELRIAIGRTGATKLQYLALGKGTRQHALIAGKTGSGKSTLFHVLITNLALWCRPDQVEFYLVDFKKGVEFKCYATHRLPHARVVAIESDRDFGLSVLQRLDEELRRRGDLFRAAQVQDLAAYRRSPGALPLPRVLLLVDEFQEFFVEEDRIAQNASVLLDRIVRQGRAFGLHVILGSQTLGGAYTVARSTLGQMVVRIALQCNEADAFLIMDEDNPAPRLLSRPGEGIYNDEAGAKAGNSPFQVVWLPDDVRDRQLRRVRRLADEQPAAAAAAGPLVFEGDAPADIRENPLLSRLLAAPAPAPTASPRAWLGAPNSIKGPTEILLARRGADNLLVVGQRDEALLAMLGLALVALAAQHRRTAARFFVLDASPPDSPERSFLDRLVRVLSHETRVARPGDAGAVVTELAEELRSRAASGPQGTEAPAWFLVVHGLQHFRALRPEDEFAFGSTDATPQPAVLFKELASEGPVHGIHLLVACDTYNNVGRFLGRKTLTEFGLRVLFQMSANDSASLIDNPAASRLGLQRALLYQEREGSLEIFRPYALPDDDWLATTARDLARLSP